MKLRITDKLDPFRTKKKRIKIALGGRGGTKSHTVADVLLMKAHMDAIKIGCFREHQNTLEDSVHALLSDEITRMKIPGFKVNDKDIKHRDGGAFKFRGLARNLGGVKSFHGFHIFWIEEGEFLSEESLRILLPTLRETDSELWITLNPKFEEDAVAARYIVPFYGELLKKGVYEDEDHYITWTNFDENPWFPKELEADRRRDFATLSRADYDHIWLGFFDTQLEHTLIQREWFDACIDAHKKLGFKAEGIKLASHDPSDIGPDPKGYAYRHGSVVEDVQEMILGDINDGGDWAINLALGRQADGFTWDCDGMGIGLKRQVNTAFTGKHTVTSMFKGSKGVDFPDAIFENVAESTTRDQKTNKEALKNRRAQYYLSLRNRVYTTYLAIERGMYLNPEDMISFSSDIPVLKKLRAELCKMPIKPNTNGLFELYTKKDMKDHFKLPSPNLADSVMMLMRVPEQHTVNLIKPQPIRAMGIQR